MLPKDLRDFLLAFNAHKVEYLLVGAYAVGVYSEPRATKDMDVLIRLSQENGQAVLAALQDFGAQLDGLSAADFSEDPGSGFQIGIAPQRVDILKQIADVDFEEAWQQRVEGIVGGDVPAHVLSKEHLIRNKLAVGRLQDRADVERIVAATRAIEQISQPQS